MPAADVTRLRTARGMAPVHERAATKLALALLLVCSGSGLAGAQERPPETWEGAARLEASSLSLQLQLRRRTTARGEDSIVGTANLDKLKGLAVRGTQRPSGELHVDITSDSAILGLSGTIRDDILNGTLGLGGRLLPVTLVHVVPLDSNDVARFEGAYLLSKDHLVTLSRANFGLSFVDFSTGETRALTPLSRTTASAAITLFGRVPLDFRIELRVNDHDSVAGLLIRHRSGDIEYARRLRFRREEVTFRNDSILLSGTLVLPEGPGPFPAIVRTHGSGPATRASPAAEWFAYNGIAFLGYDKRGVGRSTGQWRGASMRELAQDALAGVALLRSRGDIDPRRIGVSGGSEGAWVAPLTAAISPAVGFVYVGGFSGHNLGESIVWRIQTLLRLEGRFSDQQIEAAGTLRRQYNRAVAGSLSWDSLRLAIEYARGEPWFGFARVPTALPAVLDSQAVGRERRYLDFDPDTAWARVKVPVLFLASGLDRSAASQETWPRVESALRRAGNTQFTLRTFPSGNHEGLEARTGADDEYPQLHRYAPGYFQALLDWLRSTLHLPR